MQYRLFALSLLALIMLLASCQPDTIEIANRSVKLSNGTRDIYYALLSPDKRKIYYVTIEENETSRLYVMNADGSNDRQLTVISGFVGNSPVFSASARHIAFSISRNTSYGVVSQLAIYSIADNTISIVASDLTDIQSVYAFIDNDQAILVNRRLSKSDCSCNFIWSIALDGTAMHEIAMGVLMDVAPGSNKLLVFDYEETFVMDVSGTTTFSLGRNFTPFRFSSDGSTVLGKVEFSEWLPEQQKYNSYSELLLIQLSTGEREQITNYMLYSHPLDFYRDDQSVFFISNKDKPNATYEASLEVYLLEVASGKARMITNNSMQEEVVGFIENDLIFVAYTQGKRELFSIPIPQE